MGDREGASQDPKKKRLAQFRDDLVGAIPPWLPQNPQPPQNPPSLTRVGFFLKP